MPDGGGVRRAAGGCGADGCPGWDRRRAAQPPVPALGALGGVAESLVPSYRIARNAPTAMPPRAMSRGRCRT